MGHDDITFRCLRKACRKACNLKLLGANVGTCGHEMCLNYVKSTANFPSFVEAYTSIVESSMSGLEMKEAIRNLLDKVDHPRRFPPKPMTLEQRLLCSIIKLNRIVREVTEFAKDYAPVEAYDFLDMMLIDPMVGFPEKIKSIEPLMADLREVSEYEAYQLLESGTMPRDASVEMLSSPSLDTVNEAPSFTRATASEVLSSPAQKPWAESGRRKRFRHR